VLTFKAKDDGDGQSDAGMASSANLVKLKILQHPEGTNGRPVLCGLVGEDCQTRTLWLALAAALGCVGCGMLSLLLLALLRRTRESAVGHRAVHEGPALKDCTYIASITPAKALRGEKQCSDPTLPIVL